MDDVIYLRLLALFILTCSPNMSFLARLVSDSSVSLENWSWGHRTPQAPLRKTFLHGVHVFVRGYLHVRFDFLSSINFRNISGFPKLGPIILIRRHFRGSRVVPLDSADMISY